MAKKKFFCQKMAKRNLHILAGKAEETEAIFDTDYDNNF